MEYIIPFDDFSVSCELTYSIGNDSFDHAFGTEELPDYPILENVSFDESLYSQEQNIAIKSWIETYFEEIAEYLVENYVGD